MRRKGKTMKRNYKVIAVLLVCMMIFSCISVFAESKTDNSVLPFDLKAPTKTAALWLEGNDSPTTTSYTITIDNSIADFFKRKEQAVSDETIDEFMAQFDFYDIGVEVQIDWAVDDVNDPVSGWKSNEYWNQRGDINIGYDENWNWRIDEWSAVDWWLNNATETSQTYWITRGVSEEGFYGNKDTKTPGLKDLMRPGQYEYKDDAWGDKQLYFNYDEHTIYFRSRLVAYTITSTPDGDRMDTYYSDWSNISGCGKDIADVEPVLPGEIDAPVISNLRLSDLEFEGNPVVIYTLTVPDKLQDQLSRVDVKGGVIWIEAWAREVGKTEWVNITGDWIVTPGEMKAYLYYMTGSELVMIDDRVDIEVKCRYYCSQWNDDIDEFWSDWSNVITFGINGDVNEDGVVDNKDVVMLFRYASGDNKYDHLYDFNLDGAIDNKDVVSLFRYVSTMA